MRAGNHGRRGQSIPIAPVAAFVALAAIGLISAGLNSGPTYDAVLDVPGYPDVAQAAEGAQTEDGGRNAGVSDAGSTEGQGSDQDAEDGDSQNQGDSSGGDGSATYATDDGVTGMTAKADPKLDLSAIPSSDAVTAFSASGADAPNVTQESMDPISDALAQLTDEGIDAGFVFMSMENGNGMAANADQKVYGASSIKGPFVTYLCEKLVDGGEITTDDKCISMTENFKRNGSTSVYNLVTSTIKDSSNGSFGALRNTYGGKKYAAWLESLGVDPEIHEGGDWFAWYTPRDAAKMWTEVYRYLESGSETAQWLKGLMQSTNVSYIRDGVASLKSTLENQEWHMPPAQASPTKLIAATADSVSGYTKAAASLDDAVVANKAGWCVSDPGSKADYDSTSDNGIVTIDGHDYLLCIMTGAPFNERNAEKVSNLAASLLSVYDELL